MPTIQPLDRYDGHGKVYRNGAVAFEFDADLNPLLDEKFDKMSQLVGHEVDISGLPTVIIFDPGTPEEEVFNIAREDDTWEAQFIADWQAAFNLPSEAAARASIRLARKLIRRFT